MSRKPAFDPARLDDELDQLLPPPTTNSAEGASVTPTSSRPSTQVAFDEGTGAMAHSDLTRKGAPRGSRGRAARGGGGRPPERIGGGEDDAPAVSAVRIPKPLYDAVVHDLLAGDVERPSYAQIVAWTCEDHPDDVLAELARSSARAARALRGRKLAVEGVPLTLRFRGGERRSLDEITARAHSERSRVTRTAAVIAALRVAVKHGVTTTGVAGER
jgi:hypothetical protein